jgi:glycine reductase
MDRAGIPNVHINAFLSIAQSVGSNRIVFGGDFTAPTGNPDLPTDREKVYRRKIIDKALEVLQMEVSGPTIFTVDEAKEG